MPAAPTSALPLTSPEVGEGREGGGVVETARRCRMEGPAPKIEVHRVLDEAVAWDTIAWMPPPPLGWEGPTPVSSLLPRVWDGEVVEKVGKSGVGVAFSVGVTSSRLPSGDKGKEGGGKEREESEAGEMGGGRVTGGGVRGAGGGVSGRGSSERRAGGTAAAFPTPFFSRSPVPVPPTG